jgi:hypothetical protein
MSKVKIPQLKTLKVESAPAVDEFEQSLVTTKIQLPKGYLSPSQIDMYLRCPMQYKWRYVDGIVSPPGIALVEGSSHHEALATNNKNKIETGDDLRESDVVDAFAASFDKRKKEIEDWEGDTEDDVIGRGRKMIKAYMNDFAGGFRPVKQEFDVTAKIGDLEVRGITDASGAVGSRPSIVDYKTVSRSKSQAELESSLQLSFYAMVESETGDVDFDVGYVNLLKSGKVNPQFIAYNPKRVKWFRAVALSVANSISLGNFPLTAPEAWCCSERFCGYWSRCRGRCS